MTEIIREQFIEEYETILEDYYCALSEEKQARERNDYNLKSYELNTAAARGQMFAFRRAMKFAGFSTEERQEIRNRIKNEWNG